MSTRRPRICFATTEYPPHVGGAARSAQRLVTGLVRQGFEVVVMSALAEGQQAGVAERSDDGVEVQRVPFQLAAAREALSREDARRPFDLFHGFTLLAAYPCLEAAARGNRPVLASIRGIDGVTFDEATAEVIRGAAWITSVSSDSLRRVMTLRDVSVCSSLVPNGVDAESYPAWKATEHNAGVVGTVATFRPKKNIPLLVRAYAGLPRGVRRGLLLVGDAYWGNARAVGPRGALDALIAELGLGAEAQITGFVDNAQIPSYHQRLRVFVLSSDHEGMPNTLLEAAASGVPIVSTAVDGAKDVFHHDQDALLVPPGDEGALRQAIQRVLASQELAERLSAAARATAARLSTSEELRRYVELYRGLLTARGAGLTG
jgi:glycosyltransferase involved in cell wall biosynthesis